jgi:hypothetical protein
MKITPITHTISATHFAGEIERIISTLEQNGYSTMGMDFTDIVARKLSDECAKKLQGAGARIKNHSWELKPDRSLRIKLYLPHQEDLALASALLVSAYA